MKKLILGLFVLYTCTFCVQPDSGSSPSAANATVTTTSPERVGGPCDYIAITGKATVLKATYKDGGDLNPGTLSITYTFTVDQAKSAKVLSQYKSLFSDVLDSNKQWQQDYSFYKSGEGYSSCLDSIYKGTNKNPVVDFSHRTPTSSGGCNPNVWEFKCS